MKNKLILILLLSFYNTQSFGQVGQTFSCSSNDSINNSLVLCLPFNGNSTDESGNGYNGSVGGSSLITDRFGHANSAFAFDGITNYISLAKLLPDQSTLSISAWINPTGNTTNYGYVFFDGNANCGNDLGLVYWNNTIRIVATKSGAILNGINGSAQATLPSNSFNGWFHIVWTMTSTQSKIYLNGNLASTINISGSNVGYHFTPTLGCFNDGGGAPCGSSKASFYKGGIDDIRVYNRLLSPSEVSLLYSFVYTNLVNVEEKVNEIRVYPNPSHGLLNIESNLKTDDVMLVEFYDLIGKNVKHVEISKSNSSIDISNLNSGIYSVIIRTETEIKIQKVILSK